MKRILMVEDDPVIGEAISSDLKLEGYLPSVTTSLKAAESIVEKQDFDLVLLDLNLPDGLSFELCKKIHGEHPDLPIVVLTAQGGEDNALRALQLGALDFLRKPFGRRELLLRVKRYLREGPERVEFETFSLIPAKREAYFSSKLISLSPTEFSILRCLVARRGEVVSRDTLIKAIDDEGEVFDDALNTHVSRLRSRLKLAGIKDWAISSVYGMGYRLEKLP